MWLWVVFKVNKSLKLSLWDYGSDLKSIWAAKPYFTGPPVDQRCDVPGKVILEKTLQDIFNWLFFAQCHKVLSWVAMASIHRDLPQGFCHKSAGETWSTKGSIFIIRVIL